MMKKNILFLLIACIAFPAFGQGNLKDVLNKTDEAFRKAGGIESVFSIKVFRDNVLNGTSKGVLKLDGKKFYLETPETLTWFNGETQWTYLPGSDEVNVTIPTEEELQEINPYAILGKQSKEYKYALGKTKTFQGKQITEIVLTATRKDSNISKITAYLDAGYLPVFIVAILQDGTRNEITVNNNKTQKTFEGSLFSFDKKKYPTAEIIDLR
ncbi:LolA-like putative outer membrane lipoprotein chaperone [Bacteroides sp. 519]|uniref:LolA family protein n=1 Tax=Bacteroides sp. 519 TaxID=2302937 RepID=UPI0013D061D6|nr:LolA-like putative outer membrane lipoprotein chaperone [Bacteroides sp. 519]NDV60119.1 hypothetical protein [Bacteroides sp. 519]